MRFDHPRGLRQSMSWLHTWSGLLLGWLLFAIYVTGALSYVRNEITFWMQPELHKADSRQIAFDRALQVLSREAANATQWTLTLPGPRNPTLGLSWQSAAAGNTPERGGRPEGAGQREGGADGATPNRAREGSAAWREGAGERGGIPPQNRAERGETPREGNDAQRPRRGEGQPPREGAGGNGAGDTQAAQERPRRDGGEGREGRPPREGVEGATPNRSGGGRPAWGEGNGERGARQGAGQNERGAGERGARQGPDSGNTAPERGEQSRIQASIQSSLPSAGLMLAAYSPAETGYIQLAQAEGATNDKRGAETQERPKRGSGGGNGENRPPREGADGKRGAEGANPNRPPREGRPERKDGERGAGQGQRQGERKPGDNSVPAERPKKDNTQSGLPPAGFMLAAFNPAGEGHIQLAQAEGIDIDGRGAEAPSRRGGEGRPPREGAGEGARSGGRNADGATPNRAEGGNRQARDAAAGNGERGAQNATQQDRPRQAQGQQQGGGGGGGGGGNRGARVMLDPSTGEVLQGRATAGGNFLYRFHFELYGMDRTWARWIVGIATLFMFVAIISGVIVHRQIFKDFFTFRPAKGKRSWLDAHNASSVMSLPFHIVITFSGLLLFGNMMMPTAMQSAYQGDMDAYRQSMMGRFTQNQPATPPSGEAAPLTDLAPLVAAAEKAWDGKAAGSISITNPGDRNAIIEIRQGGSVSLAAGRGGGAPTLRFDGVSGQLLETPVQQQVSPSAVQAVSNTLIMLHRGFFASPVIRWLLFLAGVGGALMIATGLVMWGVARAKDRETADRASRFGQRLVEVLNVSGIAGLMVAIGAYFWANRLIPADLAGRNELEIKVFFGFWLLSLLHALLRRYKAAWVESLALAGLLIGLLPFVNALTGGLSLFGSVYLDQWLLAEFDLCALAIGGGLLFAARKVYLHVPRTRGATKHAPEAASAATRAAPDEETPAVIQETRDRKDNEGSDNATNAALFPSFAQLQPGEST